jgi:hypothetical protein
MYATTRIRVKGRIRPAPVRSTIVLFDGGPRHRVPDFGAGILAYRPAAKLPCTVGDLAWATEAFASHSAEEVDAAEDRYDEILEMRYLESAMLDRYTRGHLAL